MDYWFTFIAQIVNFLILILLMKRFLYGPIIKAMDDREARIAARMHEADAAIERAAQEERAHRELVDELRNAKETMLREASEEAEQHRKTLLQTARAEVNAAEQNWRGALDREKTVFLRQLRELAGRETVEIARKTLRELADSELEQRAVQRFIERMDAVGSEQWAELARYGRESGEGIVAFSAFELPASLRGEIERMVQAHTGAGVGVSFARDAALITGIELRSPGVKVAWSMDDYIDGLQQSLAEIIEQEAVS